MADDTKASSPLETLANTPIPEKRGRGRPPGSGKKPDPAEAPAAPEKTAAPESPEDEEVDWNELTEEEAADLIGSAVNLAFRITKLPPLKDEEVDPIRPHAKPVLKKWGPTIFKKYLHEIMIIGALWGPIQERVDEKRRQALIQPPTIAQPQASPGAGGTGEPHAT